MRQIYRALCRALPFAVLVIIVPSLSAQTATPRTAEERRALYEAHQGDFDYLLGDWEFTAVSKEHGKYGGRWSAVRLADWAQVLDEFRVLGDSGQTWYVTSTLRVYNANQDYWELVSIDEGSGLQNLGTARRVGNEVHITQRFGVGGPRPSLSRIRYYDIRPDGFSWTADRSTDEGKTWVTNFQQIQTRRIGPGRTLAPLTSVASNR